MRKEEESLGLLRVKVSKRDEGAKSCSREEVKTETRLVHRIQTRERKTDPPQLSCIFSPKVCDAHPHLSTASSILRERAGKRAEVVSIVVLPGQHLSHRTHTFAVGFPAPCPALTSIRMRRGLALSARLCWRVAASLDASDSDESDERMRGLACTERKGKWTKDELETVRGHDSVVVCERER